MQEEQIKWSTIAWSCSHLNREGQGSVKQKCGGDEDQEPLQLHRAAGTAHQDEPSPLPARQRGRYIYPQSLLCPAGKSCPGQWEPRQETNFFCCLNSQFSPWASPGAALSLSPRSGASLGLPRSFVLLSRAGSASCFVLPCTSSASWRIFTEMFSLTVTT